MNIREAVARWLTKTKPRYTFVADAEWERAEALRAWEAPSEDDVKWEPPPDPWRPRSTLGPL